MIDDVLERLCTSLGTDNLTLCWFSISFSCFAKAVNDGLAFGSFCQQIIMTWYLGEIRSFHMNLFYRFLGYGSALTCQRPISWLKWPLVISYKRACLHEGGGPQVGEVIRLGGVTNLLYGHPTYHVNVIKVKWEITWTGRLPHRSGLPHLHVNRPLIN